MPDPNQKEETNKRVPIGLEVPAADPPKLPEEEIGVPEKRMLLPPCSHDD